MILQQKRQLQTNTLPDPTVLAVESTTTPLKPNQAEFKSFHKNNNGENPQFVPIVKRPNRRHVLFAPWFPHISIQEFC